MNIVGLVLLLSPMVLGFYAFVGYPMLLGIVAARRRHSAVAQAAPDAWPLISISLPVYNEEAQIRDVLESLLKVDYPADRRQILAISDASSDGTDAIIREFASRGVEYLRMPSRSGKTASENAAAEHLRGEIIVNTDASIRIHPAAIRRLIAQFQDPTVGVASARDISVGAADLDVNLSEAGYVGYEMKVRQLETIAGGIIGASGCLYAVRAQLHRQPLPNHLSRDFAAALIAREHGYRAVSVDDAVCLVPRTNSLNREYGRKVRTMSRGMQTLMHKSHLLNPLRYGAFSWKLFSHKVCRWLTPASGIAGIVGLALLSIDQLWARWLLLAAVAASVAGLVGWKWPHGRPPRPLAMLAGALSVQVATVWSMVKSFHGDRNAAWEPTRRVNVNPPEPAV